MSLSAVTKSARDEKGVLFKLFMPVVLTVTALLTALTRPSHRGLLCSWGLTGLLSCQTFKSFGYIAFGLTLTNASYATDESLHFLTEHSPPGQYLTPEGEVAGATVELLRHLANSQQQTVHFSLLTWARAYEMALQGKNTVLFETARIPQREERFKWVGPVKLFDMRIYASAAVKASQPDINKLHQKFRACGYRGATHVSYLTALGFEEGKNLTLTSQAGDCLKMMRRGRTDIIAMNYYRYGDVATEQGVEVYAMAPLYFSELFLAFSPAIDDKVVQRWQKALFRSFKDGSMRKIYSGNYPEEMIRKLEALAQPGYAGH